MGLFGFGKKKETETDKINKMFGGNGGVVSDISTPKKPGKIDTTAIRNSGLKKEKILEEMQDVYKSIMRSNELCTFDSEIMDCITKLKSMPDNQDLVSMQSVDNFILSALKDARNYVNRNSLVGLSACLDVVKTLINDRFQCGAYFKDPKYIQYRLQSNQIYINIKNQEAELESAIVRGNKLKEMYKDPKNVARQKSILGELESVAKQIKGLEASIANMRKTQSVLETGMNSIKNQVLDTPVEGFDITEVGADVMEILGEEKLKNQGKQSVYDQISGIDTTVTGTTDIMVDGTMPGVTTDTTVDIDAMFNF